MADRSPIKRLHAEEYLLICLLSFAFSVSATRLFLELTGYPQLGGGELHIAHVLWGGLLLFVGTLLPLMFANRWAFRICAALSGLGVGLFIDEVGKFITQSNDYFYPTAAPIVYSLFIITVFIYLQLRKPRQSKPRDLFYNILSDLEELADRDFSADERLELLEKIRMFEQSTESIDLLRFSSDLKTLLVSQDIHLVTHKPNLLEKIRNKWVGFEVRYLKRRRFAALLAGGLIAWGVYAVSVPVSILLSTRDQEAFFHLINDLISNRLVRNFSGLNWFEARVGLEGSLGIIIFLMGFLLMFGKDKLAVDVAFIALLVMLTVANLLLFYFDQFSTIINATFQFLLIIGVLRYRRRFLARSD